MDSTWTASNVTYYVAKLLGFLPFAGNGNKTAALLYSLFLWIFLGLSGVYMTVYHYGKVNKAKPEFRMLMKVILVEILLKFVVAVFSTAASVNRSRGFCGLRDGFRRFDGFASRTGRPAGARARPQALYLLYVFAVGLYNFVCSFSSHRGTGRHAALLWVVLCASTMIPIVQYVTYVRMLRDRYELVNRTFANSAVTSSPSFGTGRVTYLSEVNRLYVKLHGLTEDVKTYYAYHAVLIVVESVIILISSVTTLTINFLNKLDTRFVHNGYFVGHCALRLLFLFCVVRETHSTVLESKNTALIGHEALSMTSDTMTMKYVEIIVLNCWNHPIVFDVHGFFDLDYKLLQSIIASVVTYVVVLVQIHLAIIMEVQE